MTISKAIDPKRVGISKSLITSTALCGRKGWYAEHVRLPDGSRVPIIAPERMLFGSALDEAILFITYSIREGQRWTVGDAVATGMAAVLGKPHDPNIDMAVFETQLRNAITIFQVDVLNDLGDGGKPILDFRGAYLQGLNGESLKIGEGPEALIGTPDFILSGEYRESGRPLILDLKASARAKSPKDLRSAELSFYAWLWMIHTRGEVPDVGYLTYVRSARPRYQILIGKADNGMLLLAEEYVRATRAIVRAPDVINLPFRTDFCGSCEWRKPNLEANFSGCVVGGLVSAEEEEV
jgi:hypothetical protein